MATIEIEGQRVEVDDAFLSMSPEDQADAVDEIAAQIGIGNKQPQAADNGQQAQGYIDTAKNALRMANPIQGLAQMAGEQIASGLSDPQQQDVQSPFIGDIRLGADRVPQEMLDAQIAAGRKEAYDQKPWYSKAAIAADDVVRNIANGQTFGFSDKAAAAANSAFSDRSYADQLKIERERTKAANDRAGTAGPMAEIAGSLITGTGLVKDGLTTAGRFAGPGAARSFARLVAPGLEGAVYGTASALGNDTDVTKGALTGAAAGLGGKVAGDLVDGLGNRLASQPDIPALGALKAKQKDAYDRVRNANVILKPHVIDDIKTSVQKELTDMSFRPSLMPQIKSALDELDTETGNMVTLDGLESLRRVFQIAGQSTKPAERQAASKMIAALDDRVAQINMKDMVGGDLKAFAALREARNLTVKVKKTEGLQDAIRKAQRRASSTYSGGNEENAIRQNIRRLLEKNNGRGWTADEKAVMEEIVAGTPGQNFMRRVGKLSPTNGGLNLMVSTLGAVHSPSTLAVPGAGLLANTMADRGIRAAVADLDQLIRSGGDAKALQTLQATVSRLSRQQREALAIYVNAVAASSASGR